MEGLLGLFYLFILFTYRLITDFKAGSTPKSLKVNGADLGDTSPFVNLASNVNGVEDLDIDSVQSPAVFNTGGTEVVMPGEVHTLLIESLYKMNS